jgi:hypothetical protein
VPYTGPDANTRALYDRTLGLYRTGTVGLRDFDQGVVETMGAMPAPPETGGLAVYLLSIPGVTGAPGLPVTASKPSSPAPKYALGSPVQPGTPPPFGDTYPVPVTFAFSENVLQRYRLPVVVVRRDDISPAMNRWQPGTLQYRTAAHGAAPVTISTPQGSLHVYGQKVRSPDGKPIHIYDRWESLEQATPFDITYTISIITRYRGTAIPGQRNVGVPPKNPIMNQGNLVLNYIMRTYQPYCEVRVHDSIGDTRGYEAFAEGPTHLDEVSEVVERVIGFALTLRVEAELDLNDPYTAHAVTKGVVVTEKQIGP